MYSNRSVLDLKNIALTLVGVKELLTSETGASPEARITRLIYPQVRDEISELPIDWQFLVTRSSELSPSSTTPNSGWDYMYLLPDNCLRVVAVVDEDGDEVQYEHDVEHWYDSTNKAVRPVILSDKSTVFVKYIRRLENPGEWPAWFCKMVYMRMAMLLCIPMSKDDQRYNQLARWYKDAYNDAKAANGKYKGRVDDDSVNLLEGNDSVVDASDVDVLDKKYIEQRS